MFNQRYSRSFSHSGCNSSGWFQSDTCWLSILVGSDSSKEIVSPCWRLSVMKMSCLKRCWRHDVVGVARLRVDGLLDFEVA